MKKAIQILFILLSIMIYENINSQISAVYKCKSNISTRLYNVYLLLYPSGKYYLISDYNFGQTFNYNKTSDIEPLEIWLSWGNYFIWGDKLQLNDSNLKYNQKFLFKEDTLIGKECFVFLTGSVLIKVSQEDKRIEKNDGDLYSGRSIMRESDFQDRYNSFDTIIRDSITKQKHLITGLNNNLHVEINTNYSTFYTPFSIRFNNDNMYKYNLGPMCVLKGSYNVSGDRITLKDDNINGEFMLRFMNDNLISIILPGSAPGTVFTPDKTK